MPLPEGRAFVLNATVSTSLPHTETNNLVQNFQKSVASKPAVFFQSSTIPGWEGCIIARWLRLCWSRGEMTRRLSTEGAVHSAVGPRFMSRRATHAARIRFFSGFCWFDTWFWRLDRILVSSSLAPLVGLAQGVVAGLRFTSLGLAQIRWWYIGIGQQGFGTFEFRGRYCF